MNAYDALILVCSFAAVLITSQADRWHARSGHDLKTRLVALLPLVGLLGSAAALRFAEGPVPVILAITVAAGGIWIWSMRNPAALPRFLGGPVVPHSAALSEQADE